MKQHQANNQPAVVSRAKTVHIEFNHATATTIGIAGTFNDWRPGVTEMVSVVEGRWRKELVLAPGVYEYRLVVDGEWIPDPSGKETTPNPYGGLNSVLKVKDEPVDIAVNGAGKKEPRL